MRVTILSAAAAVLTVALTACATDHGTASSSLEPFDPARSNSQSSDSAPDASAASDGIDASVFESAEKLPPAASNAEFSHQTTIRFIAIAACLNERGWSDERVDSPDTPFVSLELDGIGDQAAVFNADAKECATLAGPNPTSPALTPEYAEWLYSNRLDLANCLEGIGYTITDPPSSETFSSDLLNGRPPWDPLSDVFSGTAGAYRSSGELYELCPWE